MDISHGLTKDGEVKIVSDLEPPVDLKGVDDGLVLDSDGDTTIASPTDDWVQFDVGGTNIANLGSNDLYFKDNNIGIKARWGSEWLGGTWQQHFEGTSRPSGWSWAGSPFLGTPSIEDYSIGSMCAMGEATTAGRYFFYKTAVTTGNNFYAMLSTNANTTGKYVGIRIDNGTDNYYVEVRLEIISAYTVAMKIYYKNGGSGVSSTGPAVGYPFHPAIRMNISGTRWSNWNINAMNFGTGCWQYGMIRVVTATPGMSWTPTRMGLIYNLNSSSWQRFYCDAFKWAT